MNKDILHVDPPEDRFSPDQPKDTSRDLKFNPALSLSAPQLEAIAKEIDSDLDLLRKRARKRDEEEAHRRRLGAVFANGLEGQRLSRPIFYPAGQCAYRADQPKWLTQHTQPQLIRRLEQAGYVQGVIGEANPHCGKQSTYWLTPKANALCKEAAVSPLNIEVIQQDHRSLILKDHLKRPMRIDYSDAHVAMKRQNADAINDFLCSFSITYIDEKGVLQCPHKPCMSRIYNQSSLIRGGRFFRAPWHLLEKELRNTIRIDGIETIERDYGSMFARLAYHKLDLAAPMDCYTFDEFALQAEQQGLPYKPIRDKTKKLFNMAQNAPKPIKFFNATFARLETYSIQQADELIWKYHDPIVKTKFSDAGLGFMHDESEIAEDIMLAGMRAGIPVLPVHDSFRVRVQDVGWLEEQMIRSYHIRLRHYPVIG